MTMYEELKKVRKSRARLFSHCTSLLALLSLEIKSEKDPVVKKHKQDIYDRTFEAIKVDQHEMSNVDLGIECGP